MKTTFVLRRLLRSSQQPSLRHLRSCTTAASASACCTLLSLGRPIHNNNSTESQPGPSSTTDEFAGKSPLMTVHEAARQARENILREEEEEEMKHMAASGGDAIAASRRRRTRRRRQNMDSFLNDVVYSALQSRDMADKPTADQVYQKAQERMYEKEYGHKPSSSTQVGMKYIPFPPDFEMHRLLPLTSTDELLCDGSTLAASAYAKKNFMHLAHVMPEDPWPTRALTPANPVWSTQRVDEDKRSTGGAAYREWEDRMYNPRDGYDLEGELLDAMDELAHWERAFLTFLRTAPLSQRRSLPLLHEWYRLLVHRTLRAERRYVRVRDAAVRLHRPGTDVFRRAEEPVERLREVLKDAHRSLGGANYDPLNSKKSALRPYMLMTDAEFEEWAEAQRPKRAMLVSDLFCS